MKPDDNAPLVSIVIPSFNQGRYIRDTVQSALNQTYKNIEVIVVDDYSGDDTLARLTEIQDVRLKVFANDRNLGPQANWNKAVACAKGSYVKLLCADDALDAECVAKQMAVFMSDSGKDVALSIVLRRIIGPSQQTLMILRTFKKSGRIPANQAVKFLIRSGTNTFGEPAAGLFRMSDFRRTEGYRDRIPYVIDVDFWVQLLQFGDLHVLAEPLCSFRVTPTSWSARIGRRQFAHFCAFIDSLRLAGRVSGWDAFLGKIQSFLKTTARQAFFVMYRR